MHSRLNLKLAVKIVLGRIDGDAPADLTVEVEPQEILVFRRDADHAVGNAERDGSSPTGGNLPPNIGGYLLDQLQLGPLLFLVHAAARGGATAKTARWAKSQLFEGQILARFIYAALEVVL